MHRVCLPTLFVVTLIAAAGACSSGEPANEPAGDAGLTPDAADASLADGATADAAPEEFPAAIAAELQATLDEVAAQIAPGAALYVQHPRHGTFEGVAGLANVETGEALTLQHRFRAGSMLKTLVATAILQRVEAGQLSLDDTVTERLPPAIHSHVANADAITVRMLLQHTSGIAEYAGGDFNVLVAADPAHVWTNDELLARVEAQEPTGAPGAAWSYSNTNYLLLGEMLGSGANGSWREAVAAGVLQPLALTHSALPLPGERTCDDCARGYESVEGARIDLSEVDPSMAGAAGGAALITSPRDLATYLGALWAGRAYASAGTRTAMFEFVAASVPEEAQTGYGLGVMRFQLGAQQYYGHLGGTAGYQGFMLLEPNSGMLLTGYMNQPGDFAAFIVPVLESVAKLP